MFKFQTQIYLMTLESNDDTDCGYDLTSTESLFNLEKKSDGLIKMYNEKDIQQTQHKVQSLRKFKRSASDPSDDPWGWFEDFESPMHHLHWNATMRKEGHFVMQPLQRSLSLPGPVTTPPVYVIESTLETQQLWYVTAGQRPKQPEKERLYFEQLWVKNFEMSEIKYRKNDTLVPLSSTDVFCSKIDNIPKSEFGYEVLYRGKGSFSNSVSKSFADIEMTSITLQIPRFRVVKTPNGNLHAEFLNVVSLGNKNNVIFGIWRRHSDFNKLAMRIEKDELTPSDGSFKNTMLSWQCVLQRKKWFRCLDKVRICFIYLNIMLCL